ncbi:uncharacterized protein LOC122652374 isoform X2 [Telopea speciosissima]|uniref:uncharacterized protein LOC122652374 isoform X2 n=1 Tax=Telopea speciosissima TaxID=54955 RepID=UPI001CC7624C|nr:uncharacterized protein LOC122652374 isoform X2 [Telopea speciosissima]
MLFSSRSIDLEQRMSRGQSQPRTSTASRTLGRCTEKEKNDSIVYIDVDPDDLSDVVVIDAPGSSQQRRQHGSNVSRNDKNIPSGSIISIDDDDDGSPANDGERGGDLDSDTASSRVSRCEPHQSQSSEESDGEDCQFIQERSFPVKLSKCKRTYSGKTIPRSIFTFNPLSEGGSSESDGSDCELMEGSYGKIRDQWEKASTRKKTSEYIYNPQSVVEEQGSGSGSHSDNQKNVEVENESEQEKETPVHSDSSNSNNRKENISSCTASESILVEDSSLNPEENNPVENLDPTALGQESRSWNETQETHFSERKYDHSWRKPFFSSQEQTDEQLNCESTFFNDKEENAAAETFWFKNQPGYDSQSNHGKANFQDKEDSSCNTHQSVQTQVGQDREVYLGKNEGIHREHSSCNTQPPNDTKFERASFQDKEKLVSGDPSFCDTQPCFRKHLNPGESFSNAQSWDDPDINLGTFSCQDRAKSVSDESLCNTQQDGTQVESGRCFRDGAEHDPEYISKGRLQGEKNQLLHTQDGNCTPDDQNDIISEREKIKETDEYKRAVEEEWASRQQELQIQAEEAKRLKKRKKAESMRLLDMERRQKQRVEEMRESQKKDEETINLKEQLRVEIRRELDRLERMHNDMASLLRALGIHVGGSMPYEVNAAYRRALLKFHPDRASRTDIRQQVEAEEKFKLISRLKEKFLPTF